MRRKLILGVVALALPISTAVTLGAGSATASSNVTGTGTYKCTKITGTVTWTPGLTNTPKAGVKTVVKTTATGCTGGHPAVTSTASSSSTLSTSAKPASCGGLTKAAAAKFTSTYTNGAAPSTLTGTTTGTPGTPVKFTVTGKTTGSYPSATTKANATVKESLASIGAACAAPGGLKIIHIIAGTITNG